MPNLGLAIVRQYERGVVFRLGRLRGVRKPGFHFMIPLADRMWKVSLRTVTMPVPSQQVITQDNVSIGVAAVAYFRRVDAVKAIVEIESVSQAVGQIAQDLAHQQLCLAALGPSAGRFGGDKCVLRHLIDAGSGSALGAVVL